MEEAPIEQEQPIEDQEEDTRFPPLWLPIGSVRAIIALVITITTCGLVVWAYPVPDWWIPIFLGVIGTYFAQRNSDS